MTKQAPLDRISKIIESATFFEIEVYLDGIPILGVSDPKVATKWLDEFMKSEGHVFVPYSDDKIGINPTNPNDSSSYTVTIR